MMFWVLWGIDAVIAAIFVCFFLIGLADGSVSSFNAGLWLVILTALGGVLLGGYALRAAGHTQWARALLLLLAIPGVLAGLFFLALLIIQPRWN